MKLNIKRTATITVTVPEAGSFKAKIRILPTDINTLTDDEKSQKLIDLILVGATGIELSDGEKTYVNDECLPFIKNDEQLAAAVVKARADFLYQNAH